MVRIVWVFGLFWMGVGLDWYLMWLGLFVWRLILFGFGCFGFWCYVLVVWLSLGLLIMFGLLGGVLLPLGWWLVLVGFGCFVLNFAGFPLFELFCVSCLLGLVCYDILFFDFDCFVG